MATGTGGFLEFLMAGLASYDEVVGIDVSTSAGDAFAQTYGGVPQVRFELMDAQAMRFIDASFDTVIEKPSYLPGDPGFATQS